MYTYNNTILLSIVIITIFSLFYYNIDWFIFFVICKTLYLIISISLLQDAVIHNSSGLLVSVIYVLCVSVLKSTIRILLLIIHQNKNNSLFK